jgi:hypothetical protein
MSGSASSTTESENLIAICEEISRIGFKLNERFPLTDRADLRVFFTYNSNMLDVVINVLNTIPSYHCNERLMYLKKLSGMFSYRSRIINNVTKIFALFTVIFVNNTEYLLILCFSFLLLIIKPIQNSNSRYH